MRNFRCVAVMILSLVLTPFITAQDTAANPQSPAVLFRNARVFDGVKDQISGPVDVLVQGNKITKISTTPIHPDADTKVIDGTGRTLMPGLWTPIITSGWPLFLCRL